MKKVTYIFTALILICSTPCFSEWFDAKNIKKDMTTEEIDEFLNDHDKEFIIPVNRANNGFNINAMDKSFNSGVSLRYSHEKVDYKIYISEKLLVKEGTIYLDLLDEDKFLISSIYISKVSNGFFGDLFGEFKVTHSKFLKIKYYRLSLRV